MTMDIRLDVQDASRSSLNPPSGGYTMKKNAGQEWRRSCPRQIADRGKEIMGRTKDTIDEKFAQMGEQVMQGQEEAVQKFQDLSMLQRSPGRMPANLLMMAGEPKLLEKRKFEPTLAQDPRSNAKRPIGKLIWTTLEKTSRATGGSPRVLPKLKSEGSRRRIEQACGESIEVIPRIPSSEAQDRQ